MAADAQTFNLRIKVGAEGIQVLDLASGKLRVLDKEAKGVGRTAKAVSGKLKMLVGSLSAAVAIRAATAAYTGFVGEMANVASVAAATADELDQLEAAARSQAAVSVFAAGQAAKAQYHLASAGMGTNQIIQAQAGVMDLAAAAHGDLGLAASTTAATLSQFSLEARDSGRVADVYAAAISGSQANLTKLSTSMSYAGPVAGALGMTLEEVTAILMGLYNSGFDASQAGTILRGSLAALLNPTKEEQLALDRLGVSLTDSGGKMLPFAEVVDQLGASGAGAGDLLEIFGQRAGPGMAALLQVGGDELRNFQASLNAPGKAAEMARVQIDHLGGDIKMLASASEEAAISFLEDLDPAMRDTVQGFTWLVRHSEILTGALGTTTAAVMAFRYQQQLAALSSFSLGGKMTKLWGILASHPYAMVVAGAGILITALVALNAQSQRSREEFEEAQDQALESARAWRTAEDGLDDLGAALSEFDEKIKAAAGSEEQERRVVEELNRRYPKLVGHYNSTAQAINNVNARRAILLQQSKAEALGLQIPALAKAREAYQAQAEAIAGAATELRMLNYMRATGEESQEAYTQRLKDAEITVGQLISDFNVLGDLKIKLPLGSEERSQLDSVQMAMLKVLDGFKESGQLAASTQDILGQFLAAVAMQADSLAHGLADVAREIENIGKAVTQAAWSDSTNYSIASAISFAEEALAAEIDAALKALDEKLAAQKKAAKRAKQIEKEKVDFIIKLNRDAALEVAVDWENHARRRKELEDKRQTEAEKITRELKRLTMDEGSYKLQELEAWYQENKLKLQLAYGDSEEYYAALELLETARAEQHSDVLKGMEKDNKSWLDQMVADWGDTNKVIETTSQHTWEAIWGHTRSAIDDIVHGEDGWNSLPDAFRSAGDLLVEIALDIAAQITEALILSGLAELFGLFTGGGGLNLGNLFSSNKSGGGAGGVLGTAKTAYDLYSSGSTAASWISGTPASSSVLGYGGLIHSGIADAQAGYSGSLWAFNEGAGASAAELASSAAAEAATSAAAAASDMGAVAAEISAIQSASTEAAMAADAAMFGQSGAEAGAAAAGGEGLGLGAGATVAAGFAMIEGFAMLMSSLFGGDMKGPISVGIEAASNFIEYGSAFGPEMSKEQAQYQFGQTAGWVGRAANQYDPENQFRDAEWLAESVGESIQDLERLAKIAEYSQEEVDALIDGLGANAAAIAEAGDAALVMGDKFGVMDHALMATHVGLADTGTMNAYVNNIHGLMGVLDEAGIGVEGLSEATFGLMEQFKFGEISAEDMSDTLEGEFTSALVAAAEAGEITATQLRALQDEMGQMAIGWESATLGDSFAALEQMGVRDRDHLEQEAQQLIDMIDEYALAMEQGLGGAAQFEAAIDESWASLYELGTQLGLTADEVDQLMGALLRAGESSGGLIEGMEGVIEPLAGANLVISEMVGSLGALDGTARENTIAVDEMVAGYLGLAEQMGVPQESLAGLRGTVAALAGQFAAGQISAENLEQALLEGLMVASANVAGEIEALGRITVKNSDLMIDKFQPALVGTGGQAEVAKNLIYGLNQELEGIPESVRSDVYVTTHNRSVNHGTSTAGNTTTNAYHAGGLVERFHTGGAIGWPRYHSGSLVSKLAHDEVPIIARRGEFVVRAESVDGRTLPALEAINRSGRSALAEPAQPALIINAPLVEIHGNVLGSDENFEELVRQIETKLHEVAGARYGV